MAQGARPCQDKSGEPHPPRDLSHRLGETRLIGAIKRPFIEEQACLRFLKRAERQNARQQHRRTAYRAGKFISERAGGAPRRHIDRGFRDFERTELARISLDDAAFEERGDKSFQKWRARRDGKNVRVLHESFGLCCRIITVHILPALRACPKLAAWFALKCVIAKCFRCNESAPAPQFPAALPKFSTTRLSKCTVLPYTLKM